MTERWKQAPLVEETTPKWMQAPLVEDAATAVATAPPPTPIVAPGVYTPEEQQQGAQWAAAKQHLRGRRWEEAKQYRELGPIEGVVNSVQRGGAQIGTGLAGLMRGAIEMDEAIGKWTSKKLGVDYEKLISKNPLMRRREKFGKSLGQYADTLNKRLQTGDLRKSTAAAQEFALTNWRWWTEGVSEFIPQITMQVGAALASGGSSLLAQLATFAGTAAIMEGGNRYNEAKTRLAQMGVSEEHSTPLAALEAVLVGGINGAMESIPGVAILKKNPLAKTMFSRFLNNAITQRIGKIIAGGIAEGATEATEKAWGDTVQWLAENDPQAYGSWKSYAGVAALAAASGGGMASVVSLADMDHPPSRTEWKNLQLDPESGRSTEQRTEAWTGAQENKEQLAQEMEDAIPQREAEAVPVGEAPRDSAEVDKEVREQGRTEEKTEVPEVTPPVAKEPWQMTRKEWEASPDRAEESAVTGRQALGFAGTDKVSPDFATRDELEAWKKRHGVREGVLEIRQNKGEAPIYSWRTKIDPHRASILKAIKEGKSVPPEVLAEYPDLTTEPPPAPAPPAAQKAPEPAKPKVAKPSQEVPEPYANDPELTETIARVERWQQEPGISEQEKATRLSVAPPSEITSAKRDKWTRDRFIQKFKDVGKTAATKEPVPPAAPAVVSGEMTKEQLIEALNKAGRQRVAEQLTRGEITPEAAKSALQAPIPIEPKTKGKKSPTKPAPEVKETAPEAAQEPAKKEEKAAPPVEPPPPVGTTPPVEPKEGGEPGRSTKNVYTEDMRSKFRVDPRKEREPAVRQSWEEAAAKADAKTDQEVTELVNELRINPHTIDDTQNFMLLRRQAEVERAYEQALESGDQKAMADREAELADLYSINEKVGSELGRGLAARRAQRLDDGSFANISEQMVAAKKAPLTESERAEAKELADKYEAATKRIAELEEQQRQSRMDEAERQAKEEIAAKTRKEEAAKPARGRKPSKAREQIRAERESAITRLKDAWNNLKKTGITPDPEGQARSQIELAKAAADVVRSYLKEGIVRASEFFNRAKADLGTDWDAFKDTLKTAWEDLKSSGEIPSPVRDATDTSEISKLAKELHRDFIEAGVPDRESRVDAVWEALKEVDPEITRNDTIDAIAESGPFAPLKVDEVSVTVRQDRSELQKIRKLDDMREGRAARRYGRQPRPAEEITQEERNLEREVNEAKKRGGFLETDPEHQVISAFRTAETTIRNRIKDLEEAIRAREEIPEGTKPQYTPEQQAKLDELRKEKDQLTQTYRKLFPTKTQRKKMEREADKAALARMEAEGGVTDVKTEQQRILDVVKELERLKERKAKDLADLRRGGWRPKPKKEKLSSSMIDAEQAEIDAIDAQIDELKKLDPNYQADLQARSDAAYKRGLATRLARNLRQLQEMKDTGKLPVKKPPRKFDEEMTRTKMELFNVAKERARVVERIKYEQLNKWQKSLRIPGNIARGLKAFWSSVDASFMGRQGWALTTSHPILALKAQKGSLKATISEVEAFKIAENIKNRPNYKNGVYDRMKLELMSLEGMPSEREEIFQSSWAEKTPVAGAVVRASERGFVSQGNQQRADVADAMLAWMLRKDPTAATDAELEIIGNYVNVASWRGDVGKFQAAANALTAFFWTPRGYVAQFEYLLGQPLYKKAGYGSARVRKAILMEYGRSLAGRALFYGTATAFLWATIGAPSDDPEGWSIGINPYKSDFGKIRIRERYIDVMGGLSQATRFLTRMSTNAVNGIRSLLGQEVSKEGKKEMEATLDTAKYFAASKLTPVFGMGIDVMEGEEYGGHKLTPGRLAARVITPMSLNDIYESMRDLGVPLGTAAATLAFFGAGGTSKGQRTSYITGNEEERKEQIKTDKENMKWDSPERPAYADMLVAEQIGQFKTRRDERRGEVIKEAFYEVKPRKEYASDETYQQALDTKEKNRQNLQAMKDEGVTFTQALEYLTAYYRRDSWKGQTEFKGKNAKSGPYDPGYKSNAIALVKMYGKTYQDFIDWYTSQR